MDYRNIHKGVLPFKSNNEEWERLWKYPSRFITTTIDIPFPRLFTILFAMILDVYIGYKLFFEKEDGVEFDNGGEVDYNPTPKAISHPVAEAPINPAPPRPELPEATFNPEG